MKQRVLSLLSSTTEIIYALGCGDRLVGRSHECDYPEKVSELPICTITKFNVDGTSREVDDEVKSLVQSALSIYYINEKLLKELDLKLVKVIDTHIHADHVTGASKLKDITKCSTIMGAHTPAESVEIKVKDDEYIDCLLYTSPSPRDKRQSRMPSSA